MEALSFDLLLPLAGVFFSVALLSGTVASWALARATPGRRRLRELGQSQGSPLVIQNAQLTESPDASWLRAATFVPKSPKEMTRLRRRLATAGYQHFGAAVVYAFSEILLPICLALIPIWWLGVPQGLLMAGVAGVVGFVLPSFWLARKTYIRKKKIRNGLPDALDLLVLCLEAGSSIDEGIVKVSEELKISYPALAEEFRLVTIETRAGKSRVEAFKNFADRTKVDDVRSFVAMLLQTDRFGTSVGQALRTHADTSRTRRRQRAEERAGKLGVKLVFPLVFCLFPAFYVVVLGPAIIKFVRVFIPQFGGG